MTKQNQYKKIMAKAFAYACMIHGQSLHALAATNKVIDLGETSIRGKRASPEVFFILSTSPVEFEQPEGQLQPDVIDGIEQEAHTAPF